MESTATNPKGGKSPTPSVTVAVDEGDDIQVPDFSGKTMRDVTEICLRLRFDPILVGSSLATNQTPAAAAKVRRGPESTPQLANPAQNCRSPAHRGMHQEDQLLY